MTDRKPSMPVERRVRRVSVADSTVFIVDDDEAVRHSLKTLLETHGWTVRVFASGAEFLAAAEAAGSGRLVIDHHMPDMTGLDLAEELRRRGLAMPIILLTGNPNDAIRARAAQAGVATILEKPIAGDVLTDALDAASAPRSPNAA
jgi:two-component system response regulator FixJ